MCVYMYIHIIIIVYLYYYYLSCNLTISLILILSTAKCGIPTFPHNGYINSHVSTVQGAKVNITCLNGLEKRITCDHEGNWIPDPTATDICMDVSGNNNNY